MGISKMGMANVEGFFDVAPADSVDNDTINDVIGNKDDNTLSGPGNDSLYGIAGFMSYYHIHNAALIYPRDANPISIQKGLGAWTEGSLTEIIGAGVKSEAFDIHWVIASGISATGDYVVKLYTGGAGSEVFWAEVAFSRDAAFLAGSEANPIQGPPIPSGTRISASLLSGNAAQNSCSIKLYTHEYPA